MKFNYYRSKKNKCFRIIIIMLMLNNCNIKQKNTIDDNFKLSKLQNRDTNMLIGDCVDYIALWSALDISEQIGKSKKWVFLNYKVDIWNDPSSRNNRNVIGSLRASSYARLLDTSGDDYLVESPVDNSQGWVNKEHVKSIVKKNPKTRALCE